MKFLAVARTGLVAVRLHPWRSAAVLVCVVAVLVAYVTGVAVARGLEDEVAAAIDGGADLHVTGARFGRPAPLSLAAAEKLRAIAGVREVVPRIVGETVLGKDKVEVVVVGLPADRVPSVQTAENELVIARELARRLGLSVGSSLLPFYRNAAGERVSQVVGLVEAGAWSSRVMYCSLETAARIFAQDGLATGFLVTCEPGYTQAVKAATLHLPALGEDAHGPIAAAVTSRDDLAALLPRSMRHLESVLHLHFVLAFVLAIPLLMVTAGLGLSERRREAALLKATGWMTDELLLRGLVESFVICALGAALAVLGAWAWLAWFDGAGIAGVFIRDAARVPHRLTPEPALLAFVVSFAIVLTGTLYSTWRAATAEPAQVLR